MIPRFATVLVLATAASPAAADTLLVGPPGSGAPFTSIREAVVTAQAGDVVLVLPGNYVESAGVIIQKPISLIGAGADKTTLSAVSHFGVFPPKPLEISGLAAGEEVLVAGMTLKSQFFDGLGHYTLAEVSACAGPVVLADLAGTPSGSLTLASGAVHVQGCSQVLLERCSFSAGDTGTPQAALGVESSNVHVNACTLVGGTGTGVGIAGGAATAAILVSDSTVRLSATSAVGGAAVSSAGPSTTDHGAQGLVAFNSAIYVRGGPGNLLAGSAGVGPGHGASAVYVDPDSVLTTDAGAVLVPGADGDGAVTAPPVEPGSGPWIQVPEHLAGLTVAPGLASPGGEVAVEPSGEPSAVCLTAFSLGQGPALEIPGVAGLAVLDVQAFALLATSTLDAEGGAGFAVAIPPVDELAGLSVRLQGLSVSPSGVASFSAPALVAIVP